MASASPRKTGRAIPYAVALLVTVLWSSSFVLIKQGLETIPPIYFATLRYAIAFVLLLLVDLALGVRRSTKRNGVDRRMTRALVVAGICGYTVAQGLQFVGLFFLPAVTTSFILNFNPVFVLFLGVGVLGERVGRLQVVGLAVTLLGALAFFYGRLSFEGEWVGILFTVVSGLGWSVYVVMVGRLQRSGNVDSLRLTSVTMGFGVVGLVVLTALTREYAPLQLSGIFIILFLATVNTALAFFLWNWVLRSMSAYELTMIQEVMLVEVALFSFAFLHETLAPLMIMGVALVLAGVFLVQVRRGPSRPVMPKRRQLTAHFTVTDFARFLG